MMDEYIPSPRQTPNKPRRMRDVSALYPVDEKKLLLEALLKRQHESGPAGDTAAPRARGPWREDRPCPVCRWTSTSPATSGSDGDGDGDESDDASACGGGRPPDPDTSSVSSDSADEDDVSREEAAAAAAAAEGEGEGEGEGGACAEPADVAGDVQELRLEDGAQQGDGKVDGRDVNGNAAQAPPPPPAAQPPDPERDSHPGPGKLLYGRHCLWYQSAGFVRPQGGK